jgi:chorismate dehydratase
MHRPVRLSIVSYLNSLPLLHGLRNSPLFPTIDISEDQPAVCAEKLKNGTVDIGLIPVATLPEIPQAKVISDFCIGCDGTVDSVLLVSAVPMDEIDTILLDYQSRTSVQLVQVLSKHHWKKQYRFAQATEGYENKIEGKVAGVIIGDRALQVRKQFQYSYDLGKEWKNFTGMPFVFAVWASTIELEDSFVEQLNHAFEWGIHSIPELSQQTRIEFMSHDEIRGYWEKCIRYSYGPLQQQSLENFLGFLSADNPD